MAFASLHRPGHHGGGRRVLVKASSASTWNAPTMPGSADRREQHEVAVRQLAFNDSARAALTTPREAPPAR